MNEHEWLSTAEAARLLGISERTLRALITRGQLPAWRWCKRARWRIQRSAVESVIRSRKEASIRRAHNDAGFSDIADSADSADI